MKKEATDRHIVLNFRSVVIPKSGHNSSFWLLRVFDERCDSILDFGDELRTVSVVIAFLGFVREDVTL